jgi:hypothetical protein
MSLSGMVFGANVADSGKFDIVRNIEKMTPENLRSLSNSSDGGPGIIPSLISGIGEIRL